MAFPERYARYDRAVLWEIAGYGEDGMPIVIQPVELRVQWEDVTKEILSPRGDPVSVQAEVALGRDVKIDSIVWHGTLAEYSSLGASDARPLMQVAAFNKVRQIKNRIIRRTIQLKGYNSTELPPIQA